MGLAEHIKFYHGGNVSKFARGIGQPRDKVERWLAKGCSIDSIRIFDVVCKLPQSEIDHVKRVRES